MQMHGRFVLLAALGAMLLGPLATAAARDATPLARAPVTVKEILSTDVTAIGQPILLPQGPARVIVSELVIAPGAVLPVHKHPFPRYALVLEGRLKVSRADSEEAIEYAAGDVVIEMVDAWHYGANVGDVPVRLIVIDQVTPGAAATILRDP